MVTITRQITFDSGHRLMHHNSQCSNLHGHTYRAALTVSGAVKGSTSESDEGMVLDFAEVKAALAQVITPLDHAFVADERDVEIIDLVKRNGWKLVIMPTAPTAENLAMHIFNEAQKHLANWRVERLTLWETPNNYAEVIREENSGQ